MKLSQIFHFILFLFLFSCGEKNIKNFEYYSQNFEYYSKSTQKKIKVLVEEELAILELLNAKLRDITFDTIINNTFYFFEDATFPDSRMELQSYKLTTNNTFNINVIFQKPGYRKYLEDDREKLLILRERGYIRKYKSLNDTVLYKYRSRDLGDSVKYQVIKEPQKSVFFTIYFNADTLYKDDTLKVIFKAEGGLVDIDIHSYRIIVDDTVRVDSDPVYLFNDTLYAFNKTVNQIGIQSIRVAEKARYTGADKKEYNRTYSFDYKYIVLSNRKE